MKTFTAYVEFDPDTKLYVGIVPGLPGSLASQLTIYRGLWDFSRLSQRRTGVLACLLCMYKKWMGENACPTCIAE